MDNKKIDNFFEILEKISIFLIAIILPLWMIISIALNDLKKEREKEDKKIENISCLKATFLINLR